MEVFSLLVVLGFTADGQLVVLDGNIEVISRKSCNSQRYSKRLSVSVSGGDAFDIIRRVAVSRTLSDAVNEPFDLLEAEKQGV